MSWRVSTPSTALNRSLKPGVQDTTRPTRMLTLAFVCPSCSTPSYGCNFSPGLLLRWVAPSLPQSHVHGAWEMLISELEMNAGAKRSSGKQAGLCLALAALRTFLMLHSSRVLCCFPVYVAFLSQSVTCVTLEMGTCLGRKN